MLIFKIPEIFYKICNVETLFMEDSFKNVPIMFLQLYTTYTFLHFIVVFLRMYALFPNKTQTT